jgi:hypothetical protein
MGVMIDEFEPPRREPRLSVQFDGDGTWSAHYGVIPIASGLATIGEALDALAVEPQQVVPGQSEAADGRF